MYINTIRVSETTVRVIDVLTCHFFTLTRELFAGKLSIARRDEHGELQDIIWASNLSYAMRKAYWLSAKGLREMRRDR